MYQMLQGRLTSYPLRTQNNLWSLWTVELLRQRKYSLQQQRSKKPSIAQELISNIPAFHLKQSNQPDKMQKRKVEPIHKRKRLGPNNQISTNQRLRRPLQRRYLCKLPRGRIGRMRSLLTRSCHRVLKKVQRPTSKWWNYNYWKTRLTLSRCLKKTQTTFICSRSPRRASLKAMNPFHKV